MKKILVVSATPRREGNSDILADRVIAGARAGGAQVEKIRLSERRIEPCNACDACQDSRAAPCVLEDDMAEIYPKLLAADVLVLATPIYFFSVSAQMKAFIDRTYALGGGGDWSALAGKELVLVFTYGDSNPLYSGVGNAYRMFQDACRFLNIKLVDCLHAACGAAGAIRSKPEILAAGEKLGRRLAAG